MPGPVPKDPKIRQRANRCSTAAALQKKKRPGRLPALPDCGRQWHPMTKLFWADLWRSPMAREYMDVDRHGLYRMAVLVDQFWEDPTPSRSQEIRQLSMQYGCSPIDRRRLQWEMEAQPEKEQAQQREAPTEEAVDPRTFLRAVK